MSDFSVSPLIIPVTVYRTGGKTTFSDITSEIKIMKSEMQKFAAVSTKASKTQIQEQQKYSATTNIQGKVLKAQMVENNKLFVANGKRHRGTVKTILEDNNMWKDTLNQVRWSMVNVTFAAGALYAIAKPFIYLTKVGMDWEFQLAKINMITQNVTSSTGGMAQSIMNLRDNSIFSLTEVSDAFYEFTKAGYDSETAMASMGDVMDLSIGGMTSLGQATKMVTETMHAFSLEGATAADAADTIMHAAHISAMNVETFGAAMSYVAPIAAAAGFELREMAAAVAVLSNAGLKGSKSGTALRQAISSITNPSTKARKEMKQLGIDFYKTGGEIERYSQIMAILRNTMDDLSSEEQSEVLGSLFNIRGKTAVAAFLNAMQDGSNSLLKFEMDLNDTGYASEKRLEMMATKTNQLKSSIEGLKTSLIPIATVFANIGTIATKAVSVVTSVISGITEALGPIMSSILGTGLAGAGLTYAIGKVYQKMTRGTKSNPMFVQDVNGMGYGVKMDSVLSAVAGSAAKSGAGSAVGSGVGTLAGGLSLRAIKGMSLHALYSSKAWVIATAKSAFATITGSALLTVGAVAIAITAAIIAALYGSDRYFGTKHIATTDEEKDVNRRSMQIRGEMIASSFSQGGRLTLEEASAIVDAKREVLKLEDVERDKLAELKRLEQERHAIYKNQLILLNSFGEATKEYANTLSDELQSSSISELMKILGKVKELQGLGGFKFLPENAQADINSLSSSIESSIDTFREWEEQIELNELRIGDVNRKIRNTQSVIKGLNVVLAEHKEKLSAVNDEIARLSDPRFTGETKILGLMQDVEVYLKKQKFATYGLGTAQEFLNSVIGTTSAGMEDLITRIDSVNSKTETGTNTFKAWQETIKEFITTTIEAGNSLESNVSGSIERYSTLLLSTSKFKEEQSNSEGQSINILKDAYDIYYGSMHQDVKDSIDVHKREGEMVYSSSQQVIGSLQQQWASQSEVKKKITETQAEIKKYKSAIELARIEIQNLTNDNFNLARAIETATQKIKEQAIAMAEAASVAAGRKTAATQIAEAEASGINRADVMNPQTNSLYTNEEYIDFYAKLNKDIMSHFKTGTPMEKQEDFVSRPGSAPFAISPQDTVIGIKDTSAIGGVTIGDIIINGGSGNPQEMAQIIINEIKTELNTR